MEFSQVIFWLFCFFTLCHSICTVKDETTQSNKPCSFPFRYNDKIYYGCTTDLGTGKNILACSTKTTLAHEHIEGQWISIHALRYVEILVETRENLAINVMLYSNPSFCPVFHYAVFYYAVFLPCPNKFV